MTKKRFNYIDILIILAVIFVIIIAAWFLTRDKGERLVSSGKVDITFIAEADSVPNEALDQIQIGDNVVASGRFQDAKIVDYEIYDSEELVAIDGELKMISDPERKKIVVTISGKANKYGPYIDLGGQEIKAGSKYYIKTDIFEVYGYVVKVLVDKE